MSIEAVLEELAAMKPGEVLQYADIAKKHGVVQSTLSRQLRAILASPYSVGLSRVESSLLETFTTLFQPCTVFFKCQS
jgi:alkylated DNA nucleotide flippase Atl1